MTFPIRTPRQNNSLHKYCELRADVFREAGIDIGQLTKDISVPATPEGVKVIFRAIGEAMYGKRSTANLTTKEIQEVYEVAERHFSEKTGTHIAWPSIEEFIYEQRLS